MIYLTGDTDGEFLRFNASSFPDQEQMTKEDVVIICGNFGGVWCKDKEKESRQDENYWLDWLNEKRFTLLWVDGNHENFDRLNSDEFKTVALYGGQAQQIRPSIYRLLRGEVYEIQGKTFFTFGGAKSQDIDDGILDPEDYADPEEFQSVYRKWQMEGKKFRVKGVSWWPEELPSEAEMEKGRKALEAVNYQVDCVITHCLPYNIARILSRETNRTYYPDRLTLYFTDLLDRFHFDRWFCGHYHCYEHVMGKYHVLDDSMVRII